MAIVLEHARFAPPVALANDTSYVRTEVLPSGDLVVSQWVRVTRTSATVQIGVPSMAGLRASAVTVSNLFVAVDGLDVATPNAGPGHATWTVRLGAAHSVYLRYRLAGVFHRGTPTAHRGLARITSLDMRSNVALTGVTAAVEGANILALACTKPAPGAVAVPCGSTTAGGAWEVHLGAGDVEDRILAQLEIR